MMSCDSTWFTVSMATPTMMRSEVPPKKNVTPSPSVIQRGMYVSSVGPMNGIGATLNPLIRNSGNNATSAR